MSELLHYIWIGIGFGIGFCLVQWLLSKILK